MGKKTSFSCLFKPKETWPWPSCNHPKTESFRMIGDVYKTVNSVYLDAGDIVTTPESWFTSSPESVSFSTSSEYSREESVENIIRGLRSERLFFEPDHTNSILETAKAEGPMFKESVALAMDSEDPYTDFRVSMEEMVEVHGLTHWEGLEDLLEWYLRVNGEMTHGFIFRAFVDLLIDIASSSSSSFASSCSPVEGDKKCNIKAGAL